MEFKFVDDLDTISENDLIETLNYNVRCAKYTRNEICKLRQATTPSEGNISVIVKKEENNEVEPVVDYDFEEEVDYYLTDFKNISEEKLETSIDHVLPKRKNPHYKNILLRIMSEMERDIIEIDVIVNKWDMDEKERAGYENEKQICERRLELLRERINKNNSNDDLETEDIDNTLIFVPTPAGNIRVLEDLKAIPQDYYSGFLELFKSIKDGSFKNVKRFLEIDTLKGACEVKDFKIRVMFIRLQYDKYAILTAFMKKSDNDMGYRRPLEIKMKDYRNNASKLIKEKMDDPEYLQMNKEIEEELFRILGEKEKAVQKVKKGDEV